jgi:hypothetical protein
LCPGNQTANGFTQSCGHILPKIELAPVIISVMSIITGSNSALAPLTAAARFHHFFGGFHRFDHR